MVDPDDDPVDEILAASRDCAQRFELWFEHVRHGDPWFAEASAPSGRRGLSADRHRRSDDARSGARSSTDPRRAVLAVSKHSDDAPSAPVREPAGSLFSAALLAKRGFQARGTVPVSQERNDS